MIDKRKIKTNNHEIDDELQEISDSTILLNFQNAIVSLYPHLIPIHAFAYNAWDDIIMPLFYEMVYKTFAFKYGIEVNHNETHIYMYSLSSYKGINHIECVPKYTTFKGLVTDVWVDMDKNNLGEKVLIFKSFGDGVYFLTGGIDVNDAYNVGFNLVEVDIVCAKTRYPLKTIFIKKDDLDYEFVAETYDKKIHN
ncbi:hypothetical protein [Gottfriedia acidiceleris]|uniref:Uncharacterized protein n=1 Tax=Gottfriedia acidiceleris TaxID=371036 RepID=A0ABY4JFH1_9BACI|nr:hypothetical protein [Gottfriedia acidiceleris]UPM52590.1 hypothetical protein MY490_12135 [Gottfriedia acidiceleris]